MGKHKQCESFFALTTYSVAEDFSSKSVVRQWKKFDIARGKVKMFFRRIHVLLYLSRIVGCVPYKITLLGLQKSNWARIYSVALILLYLILVLIQYIDTRSMPIARNLTIIHDILVFVSLTSDILMPIIKYGDFSLIFMGMDRFDNQVNYRTPNLLSIYSSLYLILLFGYPIFILICMYMQPYQQNYLDIRKPPVLCYMIINTVIDTNIMLFIVLMESMLSRFRHLHRLVRSEGSTTLFGPREKFSRDLGPRDIMKLYECLVATTEKINNHYSLQILLWISTASCTIIFRLYVFSTSIVKNVTLDIVGQTMETVSPVLVAISISSLCHFTALEANRIPVSLFSPRIWTRYHVGDTMGDNFDVCMYFGLRNLKINAGFGIVTINLPAIILFISLTSTYLQCLLNDNSEQLKIKFQ